MRVPKIPEVQPTEKYRGSNKEQAKNFRDVMRKKAGVKKIPNSGQERSSEESKTGQDFVEGKKQELAQDRAIFEMRCKMNGEERE